MQYTRTAERGVLLLSRAIGEFKVVVAPLPVQGVAKRVGFLYMSDGVGFFLLWHVLCSEFPR